MSKIVPQPFCPTAGELLPPSIQHVRRQLLSVLSPAAIVVEYPVHKRRFLSDLLNGWVDVAVFPMQKITAIRVSIFHVYADVQHKIPKLQDRLQKKVVDKQYPYQILKKWLRKRK